MSQPSQHQSGHAAEALLFSDKELIRMAVPFILSFALSLLVGMLDTLMIWSSCFPFLLDCQFDFRKCAALWIHIDLAAAFFPCRNLSLLADGSNFWIGRFEWQLAVILYPFWGVLFLLRCLDLIFGLYIKKRAPFILTELFLCFFGVWKQCTC